MTPVDEEGDEDAGVGTRAAGAAGAGVVKKEQNRPKLTVEGIISQNLTEISALAYRTLSGMAFDHTTTAHTGGGTNGNGSHSASTNNAKSWFSSGSELDERLHVGQISWQKVRIHMYFVHVYICVSLSRTHLHSLTTPLPPSFSRISHTLTHRCDLYCGLAAKFP